MSRIAEEASHLPGPYIADFVQVLEAARREVRADLANWLKNVKDGDLRFTAQQYRQTLLQLEKTMEVLQKRIPRHLEATLRAAGGDAGDMAIDHLRDETARFSSIFGHSVRPLQLRQAAIMAKGDEVLIPRYRNSALRYGKDMTGLIKNQLALGMVRGETFHEMTNRLVKLRGPAGLVSLRGVIGEPGSYAEYISEGLFRRYRGWAERIVRTETLHAYNVHHLNGLHEANAEDPGYKKRWDATDRNLCDECRALDGVVVDLDQKFPRVQRMGPPAHPNCMCCLTPWREEWSDAPSATRTVEAKPPEPAPARTRPATERRRRPIGEREMIPRRADLERAFKPPVRVPGATTTPAQRIPPPPAPTPLPPPAAPAADAVHPRVQVPPAERRVGADAVLADLTGGKADLVKLSHAYAPPEGYRLRVLGYSANSRGGVSLEAEIQLENGTAIGTMSRTFRRDDEGKVMAYHGFLELNRKYQGSGIAGPMVDQSIEAYRQLGIEKVKLSAHWVGRYVWAKKGFVPTPEARRTLRENFEEYTRRRGVPVAQRAAMLKQFDDSTMREIADWDDGRQHPNDYREKKPGDPDTFKLGKAFLLSPEVEPWEGVLMLKSEKP